MIASQRSKALVVDDEPLFEGLLADMLSIAGWDCEFVHQWEEAWARLQTEHFDALITDYHMPRGNGFHFICCLRRNGITLPVIVMTSDAQILRLAPKELLHISAVLLKPFTVPELQAALAKIAGA